VSDFEDSLNELLVDTFDTILKYEAASLKTIAGVSLTIGEAHMIERIAQLNDEATVSQIAAQMQLTMPTITIAVKKMESKGYVVKVPHAGDGRRTYVRLTDLGVRINRLHTTFHQRMVRNISDQFSDGEKDILLRAITNLNEFFRQKTRTAE